MRCNYYYFSAHINSFLSEKLEEYNQAQNSNQSNGRPFDPGNGRGWLLVDLFNDIRVCGALDVVVCRAVRIDTVIPFMRHLGGDDSLDGLIRRCLRGCRWNPRRQLRAVIDVPWVRINRRGSGRIEFNDRLHKFPLFPDHLVHDLADFRPVRDGGVNPFRPLCLP